MTDSAPEIRNLTLSDVIPVMRICNQAFLEHARFPQMAASVVRYIREHPEWQWGAFRGKELLGFLLTEPRAEKQRVAIRLIATDPGAQGRGLGGRLLAALEEKARTAGAALLSVGTPFANRFYEKYGFECRLVNLKVIREIMQQAVPRPEGVDIETLDYDAAAEIVEMLEGDELRAKFLGAFTGNYREHRGLSLRLSRGGKLLGAIIGSISDFYRDFAPVGFYHAFDGGLEPLVRSFEYTASTMGLRFVGFAPPTDAEKTFEAMGYERAARDFYWTMYTLEKELG
jgi:GNAT superfamily N-acetyltransferase